MKCFPPGLFYIVFITWISWSLPACGPGPAEVKFVDVTEQSGISFIHTNGAAGEYFLIETTGAGGE